MQMIPVETVSIYCPEHPLKSFVTQWFTLRMTDCITKMYQCLSSYNQGLIALCKELFSLIHHWLESPQATSFLIKKMPLFSQMSVVSVSFVIFPCGRVWRFHLSGHIISCCKRRAVGCAYCQSPYWQYASGEPKEEKQQQQKKKGSLCQKIIPQTITTIIRRHVALETCHICVFLPRMFSLKHSSTRFPAMVSHCKVFQSKKKKKEKKCEQMWHASLNDYGRRREVSGRSEMKSPCSCNSLYVAANVHCGCSCDVHQLSSHILFMRSDVHKGFYTHKST